MNKIFILAATCFSLALASSGCNRSGQWEQEYVGLRQRSAELEHHHCRLQASIDSLWDATSSRLEDALPAGFPPEDRAIFLKARNADHIRMFMSFKQLDPGVQSLVNDAGTYDETLAAQLRTLLEQQQEFERQKIQFLQKVQRKDVAAGRLYATELRTLANEACQ